MKNDRELLEAAAKAAGIAGVYCEHMNAIRRLPGKETPYGEAHSYWNALQDDGEALRLAVELAICIEFGYCEDDAPVVYCGPVEQRRDWPRYANFPDPGAATRRAIVRAAAEMAEVHP